MLLVINHLAADSCWTSCCFSYNYVSCLVPATHMRNL